MEPKTTLNWQNDFLFAAELDGHRFFLDAASESGGSDRGPRPKGLLLTALAGCTGMDVVSILKKMKVENYTLKIEVGGEQTSEHPKHYHTILLSYFFNGEELPQANIIKAINLSRERYCGVSAQLSKSAEIKSRLFINEKEIAL